MPNENFCSMDELRKRGQVTEHPLPSGHRIVPCYCEKCGSHFENTYDFQLHKRGCKKTSSNKLNPHNLDDLPWTAFKNGNGEWIFSNRSKTLREAIQNGNSQYGDYRYWLYGSNKFIGRRKF